MGRGETFPAKTLGALQRFDDKGRLAEPSVLVKPLRVNSPKGRL
jgi:hypothetical protein